MEMSRVGRLAISIPWRLKVLELQILCEAFVKRHKNYTKLTPAILHIIPGLRKTPFG